MNTTPNPAPAVNDLPEMTVPVREPAPATDPLREGREALDLIAVDCRIAPREYLDEVRVVGGGE
ncbi:MAG: hypothetical protein L0Z62_11155 [Gemmataceae bacterium]|nr:hypothetical protein [Gemmataceae bacterium]